MLSPEISSGYKINIVDAKLKLKHIKLSPGAFIGHQEALTKVNALYPYYRSDLKTFNINAGQYSFSADDLYFGLTPSQLIVTLVSSDAYSGSLSKNPFNFKNFNCVYAGFFINGQSIPSTPFMPNYVARNYAESYLSLFKNSKTPDITRSEYPEGYCIYSFDLNEDIENDYFSLLKKRHYKDRVKICRSLDGNCGINFICQIPCIHIDRRSKKCNGLLTK